MNKNSCLLINDKTTRDKCLEMCMSPKKNISEQKNKNVCSTFCK